MCINVKTLQGFKNIQDKTRVNKKDKRIVKPFKDNLIKVRVPKKGTSTGQIITRVVSVRSKYNIIKNKDPKEKIKKQIEYNG